MNHHRLPAAGPEPELAPGEIRFPAGTGCDRIRAHAGEAREETKL